jgi:hypothetical protein
MHDSILSSEEALFDDLDPLYDHQYYMRTSSVACA